MDISLSDKTPSRKIAILAFLPMVLLYACSYFQRTAVPGTIFNQLQTSGYTALQIAALGSSFVCIYSIAQILVGIFADKYGGIKVITYGVFFFLVGVVIFPLSHQTWLMNGSRMLAGLGAGTIYLSLARETDRLFGRKNYSLMLGIVYFVGYGGGLMGTLPLERAMTIWPWRSILLVIAAISIIVYVWFISATRKLPPPPVISSGSLFRSVVLMLKNRHSWLLIFSATCNFAVYFIIQTVFGKKMLEDVGHFSSKQASGVIFALTIVCMLVLFFSSVISRMMGNRRKPLLVLSTITCLGSTIIMTLTMHRGWSGGIVALCVILYAAASGTAPIFSMSMQENNLPEIRTQAVALLNMINYLAVAVCSMLIGKFLDHFPVTATGSFPLEAYTSLFSILLIPTALSVIVSFTVPETSGRFRVIGGK